jgi:hypothetical protein
MHADFSRYGSEPSAPSRYPVLIYLHGILADWGGTRKAGASPKLAARQGFVTAAITYESWVVNSVATSALPQSPRKLRSLWRRAPSTARCCQWRRSTWTSSPRSGGGHREDPDRDAGRGGGRVPDTVCARSGEDRRPRVRAGGPPEGRRPPEPRRVRRVRVAARRALPGQARLDQLAETFYGAGLRQASFDPAGIDDRTGAATWGDDP